jgi:hypothetical protein
MQGERLRTTSLADWPLRDYCRTYQSNHGSDGAQHLYFVTFPPRNGSDSIILRHVPAYPRPGYRLAWTVGSINCTIFMLVLIDDRVGKFRTLSQIQLENYCRTAVTARPSRTEKRCAMLSKISHVSYCHVITDLPLRGPVLLRT